MKTRWEPTHFLFDHDFKFIGAFMRYQGLWFNEYVWHEGGRPTAYEPHCKVPFDPRISTENEAALTAYRRGVQAYREGKTRAERDAEYHYPRPSHEYDALHFGWSNGHRS